MDSFLKMRVSEKKITTSNDIVYPCLFFTDDKKRDWYKVRESWMAAVTVNKESVVCGYETDPSLLGMEAGNSVYEVDPSNVPADVVGNFIFKDGKFIDARPGERELASRKKSKFMLEASTEIAPLQDAVESGIATDYEKELLLKWREYRVLISRIKTELAPDIVWPAMPEKVTL